MPAPGPDPNLLDQLSRLIRDTLVSIDKQGLDPVRGALGLPQYYDQGPQAVPPNRSGQPLDAYRTGYGNPTPGPDPQIAGGKVSRGFIRDLGQHQAEWQDKQREFMEQKASMREDFRNRNHEQPDLSAVFQEMAPEPPQPTPNTRFAGVTSDDLASAMGLDRTVSLPESAPIPQARPQTASGPQIYEIQRGDTLWELARRFGTSVDTLAAANNIANPDRIAVGQTLKVT